MADDLRVMIFEIAAPSPTAGGGGGPTITGWVGLAASERGLRMLTLPAPTRDAALRRMREFYPDAPQTPADPVLVDIVRQVQAYLAGEAREFDVELDLRGHTPFELAVWAAAMRVSYGQTRSYAWVASQVGGGPGAAQAAGAALGDNPVPLIIPCHRILGSDGSLHGFAGGLDMKAKLLALESGQQGFEW